MKLGNRVARGSNQLMLPCVSGILVQVRKYDIMLLATTFGRKDSSISHYRLYSADPTVVMPQDGEQHYIIIVFISFMFYLFVIYLLFFLLCSLSFLSFLFVSYLPFCLLM